MAIGVFNGLLPLPGLQVFFSALLCYAMRSNVAVAAHATLISNPFTTPPNVWAQFKRGQWLMSLQWWTGSEYEGAGRYFADYGRPFLAGSLTSAVLLGMLAYPLTLWVWNVVEAAVLRRRLRIAAARAAEAEERRRTAKENAED
jgi:uncharacterized protein (DUF2062 family)